MKTLGHSLHMNYSCNPLIHFRDFLNHLFQIGKAADLQDSNLGNGSHPKETEIEINWINHSSVTSIKVSNGCHCSCHSSIFSLCLHIFFDAINRSYPKEMEIKISVAILAGIRYFTNVEFHGL